MSKLQYSCIFLLILLVNPFLLFAELKDLVGTLKGEEAKGIANIKRHLSKLGYISNDNRRPESNSEKDDVFDEELEEALKKYQVFFGLQVTGVLDEETVKKLSLPRCGCPDIIHRMNTSSSSQLINISDSLYAFYPDKQKWPKRNLTYSYAVSTHTNIIRAIGDAFDIWAITTEIFTFTHIEESESEFGMHADITIGFKTWDHGDGHPFDGRGGITSHGESPISGRIHLDDDEDWTDGVEEDKMDALTIVLHELGHALGLDHSNNPNASMYPYTNTGERRYLVEDDIEGMKALYNNTN